MASDGWDTFRWLPSDGDVTPGKQVTSHSTMPHLCSSLRTAAGRDGRPLLVFCTARGSSPTPPRVAIQGRCRPATARHDENVLSPQKPMSSQFYDNDVADASRSSWTRVASRARRRRIYLTGLSQAPSARELAAARPAKWAAIAPVSGGL